MKTKNENANIEGLFKQVADVIRVNGWKPNPPAGAWHFKGADFLVVPGTLSSISYGASLLVYQYPTLGPGVRVEFRKGEVPELAMLLTRLAEHVAAGPAGSRPGEFPIGHILAVDPPRGSGFEYFKKTDTASTTASKAAAPAAEATESAAPAAPGRIMGNEAARRF
jgi:hypothetical protein